MFREKRSWLRPVKKRSFIPFALAYISADKLSHSPILTVFCPLPPVCDAALPSPSSSSLSPSPPRFFWASRSLLPPASSSAWRLAAALSVSPAPRTLRRSLSRSSSLWPGEGDKIMKAYGHKRRENFSSLSNCLIYSEPSVEFKAINLIFTRCLLRIKLLRLPQDQLSISGKLYFHHDSVHSPLL